MRQDQIARSCSIGQATVHRYLEKAAAAKLSWPLPDELDDRRLDELLFPSRPLRTPAQPRPGLDFGSLQVQLQTHNISRCSCSGRSIGKRIRTATVIAAFASSISGGIGTATWYFGTIIRRERNLRRLGRRHGRDLRIVPPERSRRRRSSWLFSAPAPIRLRERR